MIAREITKNSILYVIIKHNVFYCRQINNIDSRGKKAYYVNTMSKYIVKVDSLFATMITVEAEDENGAREAAKLIMADPETNKDLTGIYMGSEHPDNWPVMSEKDFEELQEQVKVGQNGTPEGDSAPSAPYNDPNVGSEEPNNIIELNRFK
jgi:hypothetical protein